MKEIYLNTSELKDRIDEISAGDRVILSGTVYTARDAAHKKLLELIDLDRGLSLPFCLDGAAIYYAGPTPTKDGDVIGSCGPTTSSRMDVFSPRLMDLGLKCMIGKGERSKEVINSMVKNKAIYLCAIGGAGALAASHISSSQVIAFEELGCESVKRLEFDRFPLICAIDCKGGNLFNR